MGKNTIYTGCTVTMNPCDCLSKLNPEERKIIDDNSVVITYKKGEIICKQGAFASHIMFIQSGLAKVFLQNGQDSLVLKIIPEGNLLGLTSVSKEHSTFQYSSVAYIDSVVKQIDINVFRDMVGKNPEFARSVIDILNSNSAQINGRFFCLTHKQSYGRLADILLCMSDRVFKSPEFDLPLSRKDLAELCGMSPETVIRLLKKFKEDGIIENSEKSFKIVDYNRLQTISENG